MASSSSSPSSRRSLLPVLLLFILLAQSHPAVAARHLTALVQNQPLALTYHKGQLLSGAVTVDILWYGSFTPAQRTVITDFLASLSSPPSSSNKTAKAATTAVPQQPSVAAWWRTVEKYYVRANSPLPSLKPGSQTLDHACSLGKRLTSAHLTQLAAKASREAGAIRVVLTAPDVAVDGFCMSRCGTHASLAAAAGTPRVAKYAYIWVGNSATQCPGQCAWPFHQPIYGPQTPPLVAPNGDVGVDGMVINLASLLAGTVTNPFGTGYFQGPKEAPLEAASACPGVYGKGAYPGYAGDLLVDSTTGASYNANGINGRKYLLPALVDPATAACLTLV